MTKQRKIFFIVASGGHDTEIHYRDTIKNKRSIKELSKFLNSKETTELDKRLHGQNCIVWGAVPGEGNMRNWSKMEPGDYVMIYRSGRIVLAAEIVMKSKNPDLANYLWKKDNSGNTWELVYFMANDVEVNVKQSDLNKYLGYNENYNPRGFVPIEQTKTDKLLSRYGDLLSLLQKIEKGEEIEEIEFEKREVFQSIVDDQVEKAPTEHKEMQWRLISIGNRANFDVWVPKNDQNNQYEGKTFRDHVIKEFQETLDVPTYIKNIDTVWKLGLSIKAAFEIENTTSIYSGILRLSDLRAMAPNSNYPLLIVANRDKRDRVFRQLERPTFSNDYLHLDKVIKFLSYDNVREIDQELKEGIQGFEIDWLIKKAEPVSS